MNPRTTNTSSILLSVIFAGCLNWSVGAETNALVETSALVETNVLRVSNDLEPIFASRPPSGPDDLRAMQEHIRSLVERVKPAVVGIRSGPIYGSGVIVNSKGYILTAAHVAGESNRRARVLLSDGRSVRARKLGTHRRSDMGMLQILEEAEWPYLELGQSKPLQSGNWCAAMGFPGGFEIGSKPVLRLGRVLSGRAEAIRTDCTLISGDSGGPLLDMSGRVIGIHSRVGARMDVNLHIPVDDFRRGWNRLADGQRWGLMSQPGAYIGVVHDPESDAARIRQVYPSSPAARAGIRPGDTVMRFAERPVTDFNSLFSLVQSQKPGSEVEVRIRRGEDEIDLRITIGDDT